MPTSSLRYRTFREKAMKGLFFLSAAFSLLALGAIIAYLFASGIPFIAKVGFFSFFFSTTWAPLATIPQYGVFAMVLTTLYVTALSVAIGASIGLLAAICLFRFVPSRFVTPLRWLIDLLAGIPSVIYGLFGLIVIVPFIRDYVSTNGMGYGILAASLVLSIMILPTMVSVSYDALKAVSPLYYEGALALGASREEATFKIVLPAAKSGIFAGLVLSSGRALGETMAVIMVIGGSPQLPVSLTESVRTLTANIAMGASELTSDALSALVATGVVLFVFALILNLSFSFLRGKESGHV
jgi:phosphate transport system permease protein